MKSMILDYMTTKCHTCMPSVVISDLILGPRTEIWAGVGKNVDVDGPKTHRFVNKQSNLDIKMYHRPLSEILIKFHI